MSASLPQQHDTSGIGSCSFNCIPGLLTINKSKWIDIALITSAVVCLLVGILASSGVFNYMGDASANLSYGMYVCTALCLITLLVKIFICSRCFRGPELTPEEIKCLKEQADMYSKVSYDVNDQNILLSHHNAIIDDPEFRRDPIYYMQRWSDTGLRPGHGYPTDDLSKHDDASRNFLIRALDNLRDLPQDAYTDMDLIMLPEMRRSYKEILHTR